MGEFNLDQKDKNKPVSRPNQCKKQYQKKNKKSFLGKIIIFLENNKKLTILLIILFGIVLTVMWLTMFVKLGG